MTDGPAERVRRKDEPGHQPSVGQEAYRGNPFAKHAGLDISANHFERWLTLFMRTPDDLFEGSRKEMA